MENRADPRLSRTARDGFFMNSNEKSRRHGSPESGPFHRVGLLFNKPPSVRRAAVLESSVCVSKRQVTRVAFLILRHSSEDTIDR